jgi:hypothetical protein
MSTTIKDEWTWVPVAGVQCRFREPVEGGALTVRVALPHGESREGFKLLSRVARTIARERGLGRVDVEAVAHTLAFCEDKLVLHFWPWTGFGSGVLA